MTVQSSSYITVKPLESATTTEDQLASINAHLSALSPQEVIQWGVDHLPNLYQTTAFGLTGLVGIDILSKLTSSSSPSSDLAHPSRPTPPLIFLDTLYHFQETLDLVEKVKERYAVPVHVYKPYGVDDVKGFEIKYGEKLWEMSDEVYDYVVKVEPAQRAYKELEVRSVITGRRASQGSARAKLQPLEIDSTGLFKLNPFVSWTFGQVKSYIDEHNVPRNALLDQGYKSVGDWHSTVPVAESNGSSNDENERAGRWKGKNKTECGLHVDYHKMKQAAKKKQREDELQRRDEARSKGVPLDNPLVELDKPAVHPKEITPWKSPYGYILDSVSFVYSLLRNGERIF